MNPGDYKPYLKQALPIQSLKVRFLQVEEYPTLLFYTSKDKQNPVFTSWTCFVTTHSYSCSFSLLSLELAFSMQIRFSSKSGSKELASLINKHLKNQDDISKDELQSMVILDFEKEYGRQIMHSNYTGLESSFSKCSLVAQADEFH